MSDRNYQDGFISNRYAEIIQLSTAVDSRGSLVAVEFPKELPFVPARAFFIFDVPSELLRGEHAHYECHQFLICLRGSITAVVDYGKERTEYLLDNPQKGLYMPPLTWGTQYGYTSDAILAVFASHTYSNEDYIRDYEQFTNLINKKAIRFL